MDIEPHVFNLCLDRIMALAVEVDRLKRAPLADELAALRQERDALHVSLTRRQEEIDLLRADLERSVQAAAELQAKAMWQAEQRVLKGQSAPASVTIEIEPITEIPASPPSPQATPEPAPVVAPAVETLPDPAPRIRQGKGEKVKNAGGYRSRFEGRGDEIIRCEFSKGKTLSNITAALNAAGISCNAGGVSNRIYGVLKLSEADRPTGWKRRPAVPDLPKSDPGKFVAKQTSSPGVVPAVVAQPEGRPLSRLANLYGDRVEALTAEFLNPDEIAIAINETPGHPVNDRLNAAMVRKIALEMKTWRAAQ